MKRSILAFIGSVFLAGAACAQGGMMPGPGTVHTTGGGAYAGPADVVSGAYFWFGLRAYSAAIAAAGTQTVVNVRRASDSHTCDILVATSGGLGNTSGCSTGGDNGQTLASFITSTTGFVTTLYDQTGNGHNAVQATTAKQPQIFASGGPSSGLPYIAFAGAQYLTMAGLASTGSGFSMSAVGIRTGSFTSNQWLFGTNDGLTAAMVWTTSPDTMGLNNGVEVTHAATDGVWHAAQGVETASGANCDLYVDGTSSTLANCGQTYAGPTPGIGADVGAPALFMAGGMEEFGLWRNLEFSSGNKSGLNTQQHTYWGF